MKIKNLRPTNEIFKPISLVNDGENYKSPIMLTSRYHNHNITSYDISGFTNSIMPNMPLTMKYTGLAKGYYINDDTVKTSSNLTDIKGSHRKSYIKTVFSDVLEPTFAQIDMETYPISGIVDSTQFIRSYKSLDYYTRNCIKVDDELIKDNISADSVRDLFINYYNGVNDTDYIRPFLSEFQFVNPDKLKQGDPDTAITNYNKVTNNYYLKQTFRVPFFIKISNVLSGMDKIQIAFNVRGVPIFYRKLQMSLTSVLFIYPEYLVGTAPYTEKINNEYTFSNIPIDVVDSHAYDYSGTIDNIWYKEPKINGHTVTVEVAARVSVNDNNVPCFTSTGLYGGNDYAPDGETNYFTFIGGIESPLIYDLETYDGEGNFTGFNTVNFQPIKKLSYTNEINTLNRIA